MEKYSWLAIKLPAILTHDSGVSLDLAALIARTARTGQAAHDLEAMLRELRCLRMSRSQVWASAHPEAADPELSSRVSSFLDHVLWDAASLRDGVDSTW